MRALLRGLRCNALLDPVAAITSSLLFLLLFTNSPASFCSAPEGSLSADLLFTALALFSTLGLLFSSLFLLGGAE